VVLKFNAHLVKCRLKYGLCNPPYIIDIVAHIELACYVPYCE